RVSLGALGVVTEYTLAVRPRYMLRRHVWIAPTQELLEQAPELARKHRHVEMDVRPVTGHGAGITHDAVPAGTPEHP
ncbi:hypothetical protein Q6241_33620, partial [Klebsiella pneumoniae]